ncbi:MFS transporter [Bacillus sp. ISL-18]|uniref:MFS transporter n=1 Tax=Bacillus sp. ISL-18 TaxID=2819118 RepID=UPI0020357CC0|nr:glycoside-pentoside-hexuronide (GPH):cation symporter [Bacillus sp. ISL-18]
MQQFGLKDKIGYMFGDFGNDFFFAIVTYYLMVFYTDILHISPATVGVLFLTARLWDAVADVTWGRFIDSRKAGINGKFRPWILRMSIPLVISGVLMFVKIPGVSDGFHLAWAFVTYILWGTLYSTVNIPYGSMASVVTDNPNERTSLATWRTAGANFAWLIIGAASPFIFFVNNQANANRFLMGAVIFAILSLACYMACYKLSTERIEMNTKTQEKVNLGKTLKGVLKNKALLVLLLAALVLLVVTMLQGTVQTYLLKDYFGSATTLSIMTTVQTVLAFVAIPLITPLAKKFGKKEMSGISMVISGVVYTAMYFMPNMSLTTFIVLSSLAYFALCFFNTAIWAFVTDCIDYQELLTGIREDGTIYSIYSFSRKVGQAVAGGLGGFALSAVGYDATLKAQTAGTLHGIFSLNTIIMGVGYAVVGLIILFLYPLNKKRTLQLTVDLAEKRKAPLESSGKPA